MMVALLLMILATPQQFDQAGRAAFSALRDFQRVEIESYKAVRSGKSTWPSLEQHQQITAKLATAYEGVWDSLPLAMDLIQDQPMSPQAVSLLHHEWMTVASLNGYIGPNAPKSARVLMNKIQDAFAALIALFPPPSEFYEHPPARPK